MSTCLVMRVAARIPAPLKRGPLMMAAALAVVLLLPWRSPEPKPAAFGPAPAVTAGRLERMQ